MEDALSAEETLQLFLPTVHDRYHNSFTADYRHLLRLGRSPERAAREALAGTCRGLCNKYVQSMLRHDNLRREREDAFSEALLAVANAARLFNPAAGIRFGTYASRAIIRDVGKYRDFAIRSGFSHTNGAVVQRLVDSQQARQGAWDSEFSDWFSQLFVDQNETEDAWVDWDQDVWDRVVASIPYGRRQEIFRLHFQDRLCPGKIAAIYGICRQRVVQIIESIVQVLFWKIRKGYLEVPGQGEYLERAGIAVRNFR